MRFYAIICVGIGEVVQALKILFLRIKKRAMLVYALVITSLGNYMINPFPM